MYIFECIDFSTEIVGPVDGNVVFFKWVILVHKIF